ncbi:MAG: long-chain fatty acid--CoA ligase [Acidobacteriales bacterium]|nr:long-chain fatty acid--CoA ligase [Terriglobales bacterium]
MSLDTLNDIFFEIAARGNSTVALQRQTSGWAPISADDFCSRVFGVARQLREWGISRGDRVAILSENRVEWTIADFACLLLGAVVLPIYTTLTPEQTSYMLGDAGARAIFVANERQLQKILSLRSETSLENIIVMDDIQTADGVQMSQLMRSQSRLEPAAGSAHPDDLATIIYTSGTTGTPKGVMLTHGNMAGNINCSLAGFELGPGDLSVSYLPLSHVTARHLDLAMLHRGVNLAYVPSIGQLPQALAEVRPTIFVAVPRVYEKIHAQVELKTQGFLKRAVYRGALTTGSRHRSIILESEEGNPNSFLWKIADRLVYQPIRRRLGGRARYFISGGAPLGRELAEWYADVGIRIHEGYGLTETAPVIALNNPAAHKLGTVGKPIANVEVRIAEDGEVQVRGPSVFRGYWNLPTETDAAFVNGWFNTGDIGNIDEDGFLSITDRKKDLIKTSGGKFIAPQPLENSLKHHPLIAEAVVLGDRRKFPAVLISPDFPRLRDWAQSNHIAFDSHENLIGLSPVNALYEGIVADLNRRLARFEQLKQVLLVAEEFSADNGMLTASMKVRRKAVEERYRSRIDQMYAKNELSAADSATRQN